jgi:hypothetical protein
MKREHLTEEILGIKRETNWSWKHIADEIGGMSPVLVVGALLGQMKLPKPPGSGEPLRALRGREADAQWSPHARNGDAAVPFSIASTRW